MFSYGKDLVFHFENVKILFPDAPVGRILPQHAWITAGQDDMPDTPLKPVQVCDGALTQFDASEISKTVNSRGPNTHTSLLRELFWVDDMRSYDFYISHDKHWIARCFDDGSTCFNIFLDDEFLSKIVIYGQDLCRAPAMNANLASIVSRWKTPAIP